MLLKNSFHHGYPSSGGSALDLDFSSSLDGRITWTGASNRMMFNSAGVLQYAPHNILENTKWSNQAGDPLLPSGWNSGQSGALSYVDIGGGAFQCTFVAVASRPKISNVVTLLAGTVYTMGAFIASVTDADNRLLFNTINIDAGGGEVNASMAIDNFTTAGWYADSFKTGATDILGAVQFGLGINNTTTGTMVMSRPFIIKGLLPGVVLGSDPVRLGGEVDGHPLGEWIGTDDGDEPLYQPRIRAHTFNGVTWDNRGFRTEETRTNLCLQSKDWTKSDWTNINTDEPTTNNASPDGNSNAIELAATSTADQQFAIHQSYTGLTAAVDTTVSATLRPGTNATFVQLAWDSDGTGSDGAFCNFNLTTGVKGTVTAMTAGTATRAEILDIENGYFRCAVTGKIAVGTVGRFTINIVDRITAVKFEAADLADNDSLIGTDAGVEVGGMVTSVIPTTTLALVRAPDVATISDVNWFNQTEGTFYADFVPYLATPIAQAYIWHIDDGGTTDRIALQRRSTQTDEIKFLSSNSGGNVISVAVGSITADNTRMQVASAYAQNSGIFAHDGSLSAEDTSADFPTADALTTFRIGDDHNGNSEHNGYIARITYWNRKKSNTFLQEKTS